MALRSRAHDQLVERVVARLPELPQPWSIEDFIDRLGSVRGRPILVWPYAMTSGLTGMWYPDTAVDHIFVTKAATGRYRDAVILHEACHVILKHGIDTCYDANLDIPIRHSNLLEERIAEDFAITVLNVADQRAYLRGRSQLAKSFGARYA